MKGHSDRVPNKNLRPFCGRPLYHWIAESLIQSSHISQFVVDTDSRPIADDVRRNFGRAKILERPSSLCGDLVSMNKIIENNLAQLQGEHFLQTHSTNPLLALETIHRAIETYQDRLSRCDSLFSVTRSQVRLYFQDGRPVNHNPEKLERTQDLAPVYEENSNLYIFSKNSFAKNGGHRIGKNPSMFEMSKIEAFDIDEEEDFKLAEVLFQQRYPERAACGVKAER